MRDGRDDDALMTRRAAASLLGGAVAAAPFGLASAQAMPQFRGEVRGELLFADVAVYDALGEHRTATAGDEACSRWLHQRFARDGFSVALQPFPAPLFVPRIGRLEVQGRAIETFPAWPVAPTPRAGVRGPLAAADAGALAGRIALIDYTYAAGGDWDQPRFADPVNAVLAQNPAAVVAVTEGPTGGIIELNKAATRSAWPVPVVLAGGADGAFLAAAQGPAPRRS